LPLCYAKTSEDYDYFMPDIKEAVRCFFDPEAPSRGFILGSFPSDTRLPPIADKDKRYTLFKDKTLIEYDRELHTLTINIPKNGEKSIDTVVESDINIKTNGNVNITAAKNINVESAESINVEAANSIDIKSAANVTVTAGTGITITANGELNINSQSPIIVESAEAVTIKGKETSLVVP